MIQVKQGTSFVRNRKFSSTQPSIEMGDEALVKDWVGWARTFLKLAHDREPEVIKASPRKPVVLQPDNLAI